MSPLLCARQVAELLGVSIDQVDHLARTRQLVYVSVGQRSRRYRIEDVQAFIEHRRSA